jgi:hypothetical protein
MRTEEGFRKRAAECLRTAQLAVDEEQKAAWTRLAERWLACADISERDNLAARKARKTEHRLHGSHSRRRAAA